MTIIVRSMSGMGAPPVATLVTWEQNVISQEYISPNCAPYSSHTQPVNGLKLIDVYNLLLLINIETMDIDTV